MLIGAAAFTLITTWSQGQGLLRDKFEQERLTFDDLFAGGVGGIHRVPGTAVFLTRVSNSVPTALFHNLKHNKVLHERTLILTVCIFDVPYVDDGSRVQIRDLGHGVLKLEVSYGYAGTVNLPRALRKSGCLKNFDAQTTSWFMGRQTVRPAKIARMRPWRRRMYAWMLRSGSPASEYYRLPSNRVVELGSEVRL